MLRQPLQSQGASAAWSCPAPARAAVEVVLLLPPPPSLLILLPPPLLLLFSQVLESQLQTRRQHELQLEQQVAELTARVSELSGQVNSAEAANKQSSHLERQVGWACGRAGRQAGRQVSHCVKHA